MTGIQFLTDEKGRTVAVQIDLRKHGLVMNRIQIATIKILGKRNRAIRLLLEGGKRRVP